MSLLKTAHIKPSSVVSCAKPSCLQATASSTWFTVAPASAGSPYFRFSTMAVSLSPLSSLAASSAGRPAAFGNRHLAITVDQVTSGESSATPRNLRARSRPASVRANMFRSPLVRKPSEASAVLSSLSSAVDISESRSLPISFRSAPGPTGLLLGNDIRASTRSAAAVSVAGGGFSVVVTVVLHTG